MSRVVLNERGESILLDKGNVPDPVKSPASVIEGLLIEKNGKLVIDIDFDDDALVSKLKGKPGDRVKASVKVIR